VRYVLFAEKVKINEGKTKIIYQLPESSPDSSKGNNVLVKSKDRITAGDGARANEMEGKAAISTATNCSVFELLNFCGVKTHFVKQLSETEFIAQRCDMIPIEFVTRRIATGSFLRRNKGVNEGYRFTPPLSEYFFKDDENHDPQWSYEQLVEAKLMIGGKTIGAREVEMIGHTTVCVFEILERAWAALDCTLVDMKVEFGVNAAGEILLADIIDNDSWRLWESGKRSLQKDKQIYRDLKEVTADALAKVKRSFEWVAEHAKLLSPPIEGQVVILMGSSKDQSHSAEIASVLKRLGISVKQHVCSAHKGSTATLKIVAEAEGEGIPTVFIAVAGRSNGLGPVVSGNTTCPVINCPPPSSQWASHDIWSSLRLPSGLGCTTVLAADTAALSAAQILALKNPVLWGKLRARQANTRIDLIKEDAGLQVE
jgi:phosphoribosylaminoimidazole carboxylase/phosphoribosylaminoimidazole-succinocarboxamide synthase